MYIGPMHVILNDSVFIYMYMYISHCLFAPSFISFFVLNVHVHVYH